MTARKIALNAQVDPYRNLRAFVADGKTRIPYAAVIWGAAVWDISEAEITTRAHMRHRRRLFFTTHSAHRVPVHERTVFEGAFSDVIKACIVHRRLNRGMQASPQQVFLRAARYLYDAASASAQKDPTLLSRSHFVFAENAILDREQLSSAYRVSVHLQELAEILDRNAIARSPIEYRSSIPRPQPIMDRTSSTFEDRVGQLPTTAVLDALAEISNDAAVLEIPFDRLRIRIAELLFVSGFRIGEGLSLPANTLVKEIVLDERGDPRRDASTGQVLERLGLRYWPEKGGDPVVKWMPTVANPLVRRAIADINSLCELARQNALWLEAHPGDVPLAIDDARRYSMREVAKILGLADLRSARRWLVEERRGGDKNISRQQRGNRRYVTGAMLRHALVEERYDKPMLVRRDGQKQSLGESLIVLFRNAHHATRAENRFVSVPLTWQHMSDFLCGKSGVPSIFERLNYRDDSGKPLRIKTHDFRRLLNTIANRGGLSQLEIARWMGRRRIDDNAAYDYRTPAEMARAFRPLIMNNEVYGDIAKQVLQLAEAEREAFLESRLAMVHMTPYGHCGSTIAESPCATAVSCLGGCRHFLRRKGDERSRTRLVQIESEALVALQRAREARNEGQYNADNWVRAQETVLRIARAAIAIDEDDRYDDGAVIPVNPDGPLLGEPLS